MDAARALSPDRFQRAAAHWHCIADTAAADSDALRLYERRYLHVTPTFGGAVVVDGILDPEGGARVLAALDALDQPDPTCGPTRSRLPPLAPATAVVGA